MLNQEELITSAYHEAGHAVIAWYYGRHILGAFVSQDKNKNGNCEIIRLFGKFPDIEVHELEREMDIISFCRKTRDFASEKLKIGHAASGLHRSFCVNARDRLKSR